MNRWVSLGLFYLANLAFDQVFTVKQLLVLVAANLTILGLKLRRVI